MFSISLYGSLTFPPQALKRFTPLIEAFLKGYYGKGLNAEIIKSMKLAELYIALKEILTSAKALCTENSPAIRLITILKIRRFKKAIKGIILPRLIT